MNSLRVHLLAKVRIVFDRAKKSDCVMFCYCWLVAYVLCTSPTKTEAGISKNYFATKSGWPEVELRFCPLFNYWTGWSDLSPFLCPYNTVLCVSQVMANEWRGAFLWPLAFSHLCCGTQRRMGLHRGAWPKRMDRIKETWRLKDG